MGNTQSTSSGKLSRRKALKRLGRTGAFIIPTVMTFKMTELTVRASGITTKPECEQVWKTYWDSHTTFLNRQQDYWQSQETRFYRLWTYLKTRGWI
jgi:hypothetical protein